MQKRLGLVDLKITACECSVHDWKSCRKLQCVLCKA